MSKSSFVVGAAGLEPALLARAGLPRQRSRMSNNINVLSCMPFLIPYTGLCSHSEAEVSLRFHRYPAGVRLGVLKPKPNCAVRTGLSMTLTKFSIWRTAVRIWLFPYVRAQDLSLFETVSFFHRYLLSLY